MYNENRNGENICANIGKEYFGRGKEKTARKKMKLELEKVAGTVVSAVVTAMVIGAAAIVWRGATTVDAKVNQATHDLSVQAAYITKAVDMLETEVLELKKLVKSLADHQEAYHHNIEVPQEQFIQRQLPEIRKGFRKRKGEQ
jgi:hypothetical protein